MDYHYYDKEFWIGLMQLVTESEIIIDRPRGTRHPQYENVVYPVDYGYLSNTNSMDGGGIDIWRGSKNTGNINAIICIIDLAKRDSEIKILLDCSEVEQETIYKFHNDSGLMKGLFICNNAD